MSLKRIVIAFGLAAMAFGIWTLAKAHSQVGTCTVASPTGAAAHSGIDSTCVQTLMSYSLGFVFVASGLIIGIIAYLGYRFLNSQVDKATNRMEVASADFIDVLQEPTR